MKKSSWLMCLSTSLFSVALYAEASQWPQLKQGKGEPLCTRAMELARLSFESKEPYIHEGVDLPSQSDSAYLFDSDPQGEIRSLYGEKLSLKDGGVLYPFDDPVSGRRLVLQIKSHSWRGDRYWLFSVDKSVSSTELLSAASADFKSLGTSYTVSESWLPPLILWERATTHQVWTVDPGHPADFLGKWIVYALEAKGLRSICEVHFKPNVRRAEDMLPSEVKILAVLLDQTLGPGLDEGTLQPTARLRVEMGHVWANAALRPWALATPYNDRTTVDIGLRAWAWGNPHRKQLHKRIMAQYPLAEQALARHYKNRLGYSPRKADLQAAIVLDGAFRNQFTFSNRNDD